MVFQKDSEVHIERLGNIEHDAFKRALLRTFEQGPNGRNGTIARHFPPLSVILNCTIAGWNLRYILTFSAANHPE